MKALMILLMATVLGFGTYTLATTDQYCYEDNYQCQIDCYWDCDVDGYCDFNQCLDECDDELDYCLGN